MTPTFDTHLIFVTMHEGFPVLNWRCRQTGEPVYIWDYTTETPFSPEEARDYRQIMRDSRVDPQYDTVFEKAQQWDFGSEKRKARELLDERTEEIAQIIRDNRHRSDYSLARMIVEIGYRPDD